MNKILFPRIFLWLLLFIPLTLVGFYPTYFSQFIAGVPSIYHIHAFFMTLWIVLAVLQPYLIYKKKTKQHKFLGKLSYFIMPLVLISAWFMTRHSYFNFINAELTKTHATKVTDELRIAAGEYMRIGVVYASLLAIFYLLAVINRKRMVYHATFMFAATLTLIGPTVDRIIIPQFINYKISIDVFISSFLLIDALLIALLIYQYRKGTTIKPVISALMIYVVMQTVFYIFPKMKLWYLIIDPLGQ